MHSIDNHITPRLKMILSLVPKGDVICDIGTDHGYIPIYLAENNLAKRVIASDINKGPLYQAQKNIESFSLDSIIETRLSDGFSSFSYNEADTAIIAGMGGELIARILKTDIGVNNFILQPQTMHHDLRKYLCENGYEIKKEAIAREQRKMYTAILATKGEAKEYSRVELEIGPYLIAHRPPFFEDYVRYRLYEIKSVLSKLCENANTKEKRKEYLFLKNEYEKLINGDKND